MLSVNNLDLNASPEYPYPNNAKWLTSNDNITAKLFHIKSIEDYLRACALFPLYTKVKYPERENTSIECVKKMMDVYSKFNIWRKELCEKTGFNQKDLISSEIKEPLKFFDKDNNPVKIIFTKDKNRLDENITRIAKYERSKVSYSGKDAIIFMNQICEYILGRIKEYAHFSRPSKEDMIAGIDYNAMRSSGYDGIYIHTKALSEGNDIEVHSNLYKMVDSLLYWTEETICLWNYS
jgi:hypothetical protein